MHNFRRHILASCFIVTVSLNVTAIENEDCLKCHSDKKTIRADSDGMRDELYLDNSRFKLSVHNINGVSCNDCHSDIKELDLDQKVPHSTSLKRVLCEDCHSDEFKAYQESVHMHAKHKGITIPCYACHGYHYVSYLEADSVNERENKFCLKCHDPNKFHDWLPQKETHFAHVECAVCHVDPGTPRYVNLRYHDFIADKFLSGADILSKLNTDFDGFMGIVDTDKDKEINVDEFESMALLLKSKGAIGAFHGEVLIDLVPDVHKIKKGGASRDCNNCHNPESPFFSNVYITLNREDGTSQRHKLSREVLSSYFVNHFYALGSTRVRLLDKIGFTILALGLMGVAAHLFLRLFTINLRRRIKKEKEAEQL